MYEQRIRQDGIGTHTRRTRLPRGNAKAPASRMAWNARRQRPPERRTVRRGRHLRQPDTVVDDLELDHAGDRFTQHDRDGSGTTVGKSMLQDIRDELVRDEATVNTGTILVRRFPSRQAWNDAAERKVGATCDGPISRSDRSPRPRPGESIPLSALPASAHRVCGRPNAGDS